VEDKDTAETSAQNSEKSIKGAAIAIKQQQKCIVRNYRAEFKPLTTI
jgi:hypothetical protein